MRVRCATGREVRGDAYRTYPKVRLRLSSELTGELIHRLLTGELDVAAVLLPEGKTTPPPLLTNIIASDRMEIVQGGRQYH
jgi:hypothetical protein